ncbi:MAG: YaeQ family protein [Geobacteraceae bacterium]|nr:YaeQ family protein [Geobacteraceae bacterium]NTW81039.1 YaeQ family protein [Geobacteraceae bacterium]
MALPSTIYRVNIQLSDVDRGVYESLQTTVARHPSETEERLVARLLAYAIFFEPELAFTKGVSAGDEPDLWLKGPDDRVLLWVEVGLPEPERLVKAGRHAERVAVIACGRALPKWEQQHLQKIESVPNLTVVCFDQLFVNGLVSKLDRSINWSVTITDGNLYINVGNETFETVLQERVGKRLK